MNLTREESQLSYVEADHEHQRIQHIFFLVFFMNLIVRSCMVVSHSGKRGRQPIALKLFERGFVAVDIFNKHIHTWVVSLLAHLYNGIKVFDSCQKIGQPYKCTPSDHRARDSLKGSIVRHFNHRNATTYRNKHLRFKSSNITHWVRLIVNSVLWEDFVEILVGVVFSFMLTTVRNNIDAWHDRVHCLLAFALSERVTWVLSVLQHKCHSINERLHLIMLA